MATLSDMAFKQKVDPSTAAAASGEEDITEGGDGGNGGNGSQDTGGWLEP